MAHFTEIPAETFNQLQINAGEVVENFDVKTATIKTSDILFATTGGLNFTAAPTYTDYGEDIDNCPANMLELKRLDSQEIKLAGTALSISPKLAKFFIGAADIDKDDQTKVVPRNDLALTDFKDLWWVGDYGEDGFVAIHMLNALNTAGFALQSTSKGKGQFAFEFTAHYSMQAQDKVPYEIYVVNQMPKTAEAAA